MTTCKLCHYREGAPVSTSGSCFGAPPAVHGDEGKRARQALAPPNNPAVQAMEEDHG